jgi:outer membrane protein assembly factor BamB
MWSLTPSESGVTVPSGLIFGFQFQAGFDGTNTDTLQYFALGQARAFQTITPPLITNEGRSAYWGASRSEYYCFAGKEDLNRVKFNRGPNIKESFETNSAWNGQPIWTVPAVVTDENGDTVIFGGTAFPEFFRLNHRFDVDDIQTAVFNTTVVNTTSFVLASAVVDPLNRAVYYVESDGKLHQVDFTTIEDIWSEEVTITDGVQSEMAMNGDGSILYVVSTEGKISALSLTEGEPTSAPNPAPTVSQPSAPNTAGPTGAVQPSMTGQPTVGETSPDGSASSAKSMLVAFVAVISSLFL